MKRRSARLTLVALDGRADEPIVAFSVGMRRRLNLASGILHRPRVLLLDEPTVGVDPAIARAHLRGDLRARDRRSGGALQHALHGGGGATVRPRGPARRGEGRRRRARRRRSSPSSAVAPCCGCTRFGRFPRVGCRRCPRPGFSTRTGLEYEVEVATAGGRARRAARRRANRGRDPRPSSTASEPRRRLLRAHRPSAAR